MGGIAYSIPLLMEEKDTPGSLNPEPQPEFHSGLFLEVASKPEVNPAPDTTYVAQAPVLVKPNVPHLGDVLLLQEEAAASFHLPRLDVAQVGPPDECAKGCPTPTPTAAWWLSTEFRCVHKDSSTIAFAFAALGATFFPTPA